jgi:uncharacterized protein YaaW (UPF0174 family)
MDLSLALTVNALLGTTVLVAIVGPILWAIRGSHADQPIAANANRNVAPQTAQTRPTQKIGVPATEWGA